MTTPAGTAIAAAAALLCGAGAASAALIDFTASSSLTGSAGGVGYTVSGSPGDTLTFPATGAPGPIGGLAGLNDGIGLNDDEIGNATGEYVTVTFDRAVRLSRVFLLDLFADTGGSTETAWIYSGANPSPATADASVDATEPFAPGGFGFAAGTVDLVGDSFTFDAGEGNDGRGIGDFALAGLGFEPAVIPLPAAGLLLGTALFGLGLARRRAS